MAIVEVTRSRILKAIKTEPIKTLRPGQWVGYPRGFSWNKTVAEKSCSVCAVGAVMRNVLDPSQSYEWIDNAARQATDIGGLILAPHYNDLKYKVNPSGVGFIRKVLTKRQMVTQLKKSALKYLNEKNCMAVLSYLFEGLCGIASKGHYDKLTNTQLANIRRSVYSFVKNNFPHKVKIDIDGAKPAKDITVVDANDWNSEEEE